MALKEIRQLKAGLAAAEAAAERAAAVAAAQVAALAAQLAAAQAGAAVDARDMTENVIELEAKLQHTRQQLAVASAGAPLLADAAPEPEPEPELAEPEAEATDDASTEQLAKAQEEVTRLNEELGIGRRQHVVSQQAIQSLERRVRELEGERRPMAAALTVAIDSSPAAVAQAPPPLTPATRLTPTLSRVPELTPTTSMAMDLSCVTAADVTPSASPAAATAAFAAAPLAAAIRERKLRDVPCKSGALKKHTKGKFSKDGHRHVQLFDSELRYQKNELNMPAIVLDQ